MELNRIYALGASFGINGVYVKVEKGASCTGCHFFSNGCDDPHYMRCTSAYRKSTSVRYIEITKEEHESNQLKDLVVGEAKAQGRGAKHEF